MVSGVRVKKKALQECDTVVFGSRRRYSGEIHFSLWSFPCRVSSDHSWVSGHFFSNFKALLEFKNKNKPSSTVLNISLWLEKKSSDLLVQTTVYPCWQRFWRLVMALRGFDKIIAFLTVMFFPVLSLSLGSVSVFVIKHCSNTYEGKYCGVQRCSCDTVTYEPTVAHVPNWNPCLYSDKYISIQTSHKNTIHIIKLFGSIFTYMFLAKSKNNMCGCYLCECPQVYFTPGVPFWKPLASYWMASAQQWPLFENGLHVFPMRNFSVE